MNIDGEDWDEVNRLKTNRMHMIGGAASPKTNASRMTGNEAKKAVYALRSMITGKR